MKSSKFFVILFLIAICMSLVSCNSSSSGSQTTNGTSSSDSLVYVLNKSNVHTYYDVTVSDARKSYDTGYVYRYKITFTARSRTRVKGKATVSYKVRFSYKYYRSSGYMMTGETSSKGTITLYNGQINSNEGTVSFACKMDSLASCSGYVEILDASGELEAY